MSGNSKKIIAFNYFGGKFTWLEHLYAHFPSEFTHLADVFAGSMGVSLNYPGKVIKSANEINEDITNFFAVLRDHQDELIELLLLTPCSKAEYNRCWEKCDDPIERARRFYVRIRQSFFGLGAARQNKGWHMAKKELNAHGGETVSKWNNAIRKLGEVANVIRNDFQIMNLDYADFIDRIDFPNAFFYCDPPYLKEVRNSFNNYLFEFTDEDHAALAEKLHNIEGKAMVSGYNSKLYDGLYSDWRKVELPSKLNNIRSARVQEVIWMNYENTKHDLFTPLAPSDLTENKSQLQTPEKEQLK